MKTTTASEYAKYIISLFQKQQQEISNLKLQKLLYYAQGWHLALYGAPIFGDRFEAWVHGPVVPAVFREYRDHAWRPIDKQVSIKAPEALQFHLAEVVRIYGHFDASTLERMTHQEVPWKEARQGLEPDEPSNRVITDESMRRYFEKRADG